MTNYRVLQVSVASSGNRILLHTKKLWFSTKQFCTTGTCAHVLLKCHLTTNSGNKSGNQTFQLVEIVDKLNILCAQMFLQLTFTKDSGAVYIYICLSSYLRFVAVKFTSNLIRIVATFCLSLSFLCVSGLY